VIVLNYHGVTWGGKERDPWDLRRKLFEEHLEVIGPYLRSPSHFAAHCDQPEHLRAREVLLTFDDGRESDYSYAFPKLHGELKVGFISFVNTANVGRRGFLSWPMLQEMSRHGVPIGSHGHSHVDLTTLAPRELRGQLESSRKELQDRTGQPVTLMAFPFGKFNRRVWEAALAEGYSAMFTITPGHHRLFRPFLFSRLCVRNEMGADFLRAYLRAPDKAGRLRFRIARKLNIYNLMMEIRYRF